MRYWRDDYEDRKAENLSITQRFVIFFHTFLLSSGELLHNFTSFVHFNIQMKQSEKE